MKKNRIEELIVDYLSGEMDAGKAEEFKEFLSQNGYDLKKLKKLEETNEFLEGFSIPEPSAEMHARFFSMLEDSKRQPIRERTSRRTIFERMNDYFQSNFVPKLAYSLLMIVIGIGIGNWFPPGQQYSSQISKMSTEVKEIREMMIFNLVNHPSATERMKTVNLTSSFENLDDKIVTALLNTLNSDPNVNVRLAAIETLSRFADNPEVRQGLIQSISKQESPLTQLSLADVMVTLNEKRAVDQLRVLVEKKGTNSAVKTRIEECIKFLI
ncbi:MAG: HEAT repeat domain-containing protein [bacterium]|nr:HEAT repeat domain-containing protein [bacterium]